MEAAMTDYDCRTIEDRLAALEARLAQTDDALTGQYAGLSRRVDWLRSDVQDMRIRLDALWLALDGPEDRLKEAIGNAIAHVCPALSDRVQASYAEEMLSDSYPILGSSGGAM